MEKLLLQQQQRSHTSSTENTNDDDDDDENIEFEIRQQVCLYVCMYVLQCYGLGTDGCGKVDRLFDGGGVVVE